MIEHYWPWWVSAIGLAVITIGFALSFKRPLGTSGSWTRVVTWRNDKIIEKAEAPFRNSPKMLEDALMRATIEEFGETKVNEVLARRSGVATVPAFDPTRMPVRIPWTVHLTFLTMLIVGGFVASTFHGSFDIRFTLGELHTHYFGHGMGSWFTLIIGGVLVGFGTQLGGGCTSGHGLSGVSRFVPASLLATIFFVGGGIVASFVMQYSGVIGQ